MEKELTAFKQFADCMEPFICQGDIVIFDPDNPGGEDDLKAIRYKDIYVCAKAKIKPQGVEISYDNDYPPRIFSHDDIEVLGKVTEIRRHFD